MKNGLAFMKKYPEYNAIVHAIGGMAVGILIMYRFNLQKPLMWVIVLGSLSLAGHLYAFLKAKK